MVKKNRLVTTTFREIKNSFPRFFSLLLMSFLGVFVFAGLKATAPAMMNSLDAFYKSANVYDIKLTSTVGFDNNAIDILKKIDGVNEVELSNYKDVVFKDKNDKEVVIKLISTPSTINLLSSEYDYEKLKKNEILVEENFIHKTGFKINDEVLLDDVTYTIKGVVSSPLFYTNVSLNQNRGKTNVGNGTINYYGYINNSSFNVDYYVNAYITLNGANNYQTNSKPYLKKVDDVSKKIEEKINDLLASRYDDINNNIGQLKAAKNFMVDYDAKKSKINATLNELNLKSYEEFINYFNTLDVTSSSYESLKLISDYIKYINDNKNSYDLIIGFINSMNLSLANMDDVINKYQEILNNKSGIVLLNDRLDYSTYKNYIDDTKSITNLSFVFPIVFFLVAILVSLVSMNRMVEDDRLMIGTFKSLGFANKNILFKYMMFAFLATLSGGIFGVIGGVIVIPTLINNIYKLLFDLPKFYLTLNIKQSILGFLIAILCICGTTLYTVLMQLKEKPAELLRAKAPKPGKKILLERIHFIWKRIKFSNKITIRNICRYKKRVAVTIFGIAGCCALMLCGWGIKDSITDIPTMQYQHVLTLDAIVNFNNVSKEKAAESLNNDNIESYTLMSLISGTCDNYEVTINVVSDNYNKFLHLYDINSKEEVTLNDNEVIVSDKLAQLLKLKVNENLSFYDDDYNNYNLKIKCIVENYVQHYLFITETTYKAISKNDFKINTAYINSKDINDNFIKGLLQNDDILNVMVVKEVIDNVSDMLTTLNKVVIILIVLAALLAFVVLYNLSNINIHERKREIATLKVLGFYPYEVDKYITLENIILTIIGVILGLVFGYFLTNVVVSTVEIEYVRFIHKIKFSSYIYAAILSFVFTIVVNFITHFKLEKINMIESLKSVE